MATKYVAPAAAGAGNGSDVDNPMSLKVAFAECTAGDTYKLASGTYTRGAGDNDWIINNESTASEVIFESSTGNPADVIITSVDGFTVSYYGTIYVLASTNSVILKFRNVTVTPGTGAAARYAFYFRSTGVGNVTVTLDNCRVTGNDHDGGRGYASIFTAVSSTGRIYFTSTDTNMTLTDTAKGFVGGTGAMGSVSISGGTWTHTGTAGEIIIVKTVDGMCKIGQLTVVSSTVASNILDFGATAATNALYLHDINITASACSAWLTYIANYWKYVHVDNVTMTVHDNTTETSNGLCVGVDSQTPTEAMGQVVVRNVTLGYTGTTDASGHGILIGGGADGAEVCFNRVVSVPTSTESLGLVVKAENCNFHHNIITGHDALYLKGGHNNHVHYNTFITTGGAAARLVTDTDESKENILTNNIFDGSDGEYCIKMTSSGHFNNNWDTNDYRAGSKGIATFDNGTTDLANLAALQAYWDSLSDTLWTDNDASSVELPPRLDSNYRPRNRTIARLGIGAVMPTAQTLGGAGIFEIAP